MKILISICVVVLLASCLSRNPEVTIDGTLISGASIVAGDPFEIADKKVILDRGSTPWTYKLIVGSNVVAKAESAIMPDRVDGNKFSGTIDVTYNRDTSKLVIREDISDGTECARFIFFNKADSGKYDTRYLNPSPRHWDAEPLAFEIPYVVGFEADGDMILHYKILNSTETSSVEAFAHPTNVN